MTTILLDFFNFLKRRHHDQDRVDNLNTHFVGIVAVAIGFLLFASEYGVHSIQCFPKASWRSGWKQYAEDLCFIEGSYFVDVNAVLPHYSDLPNYKKISFYQWTPFIFLFFAVMFYLPRCFWSYITSTSYLFFTDVCESSVTSCSLKYTNSIRRFAEQSMRNPPVLPPHFGFDYFNRIFDRCIADKYMILSYLIVKIWHVFNVFAAHYLLCLLFVDNPHDPFGYNTVWNILMGVDWRESGAFPRLTTCDIATRQYSGELGDRIKHEQVQCLLVANVYIEKIFLVTWIMFGFLFVINIFNCFHWMWNIYHSKSYARESIQIWLGEEFDEEVISETVNLLLPDAVFTLMMVRAQSGDIVSTTAFTECFIFWEEMKELSKKFD